MSNNGPQQAIQVFISYAHADNDPVDESAPGWLSKLVDNLRKAAQRHPGGSGISFWMDHRLEPQRQVNDELRRQIRDSQIILAFLSPRYLESVWCKREMQTFVEEVGGGLSCNRVFLVEVLPTEREDWHPAITDLSPVALWKRSLTEPEPMSLGWPVPDPKADRDYWKAVNHLASILARQASSLPALHESIPVTPPAPPLPQPATATPDNSPSPTRSIWIADPTDDVVDEWELLRAQLIQAGHSVLPAHIGSYPFHDQALFEAALQPHLHQADLLLQILGALPGPKPPWSAQPKAPLQAALAQALAAERQRPFLTWHSPELSLASVGHPDHRALFNSADSSDLPAFIRRVLDLLKPPPAPRPATDEVLSVLINACPEDLPLGRSAQALLGELEVDATLAAQPHPAQAPAQYRAQMEDCLRDSSGMLIIYGQAAVSWVQAQYAQARKVLAQERRGLWGGLLDGPPKDKTDHGLSSRNLMLLDCRQGLRREPLSQFVRALRDGGRHV